MVDFMPKMAMPSNTNPLQKYFRQPKLFIQLPSKGKYYPKDALEMTETGELPVYSMTAKDELLLKTPDALLNGQATVDVIQSCVPNIKNAWFMPSIDLDAILIAIRIATYGENLDLTTKIPVTNETKDYVLSLNEILAKLCSVTFVDSFDYQDMFVKIKPLTYKEFTQTSLKTFEEQRIFRIINDDKISEEEKLAKFSASFKKLTDINIDVMAKSVYSITVDGVEVNNPAHIQDFFNNSEKSFFSFVLEHLEKEKRKFQIEPLRVITTEEDRAKGAPEEFSVPITFDQSNFFG